MTAATPQGQSQNTEAQKPSDKELNFRALEQRYERQLQAEREARLEAEKRAQEAQRAPSKDDDEEEETEPYINHKKLNKTLQKFGQNAKQETQSEIQKAVQTALQEERKQNWIRSNADFYDVLQHAEKFAQHDPELAETILQMPEGFERQKLVYKNIKALGLHKDLPRQPTIQDKIDANRKSPYYQPSGISTNPYSSQGDYSASGQKQAYDKMQELKNRLRI